MDIFYSLLLSFVKSEEKKNKGQGHQKNLIPNEVHTNLDFNYL